MIRSSGTHATLAESSAVLIDAPAASAASQLETRAIARLLHDYAPGGE